MLTGILVLMTIQVGLNFNFLIFYITELDFLDGTFQRINQTLVFFKINHLEDQHW